MYGERSSFATFFLLVCMFLLNKQIHESQNICSLTALMKVCVGNETPWTQSGGGVSQLYNLNIHEAFSPWLIFFFVIFTSCKFDLLSELLWFSLLFRVAFSPKARILNFTRREVGDNSPQICHITLGGNSWTITLELIHSCLLSAKENTTSIIGHCVLSRGRLTEQPKKYYVCLCNDINPSSQILKAD